MVLLTFVSLFLLSAASAIPDFGISCPPNALLPYNTSAVDFAGIPTAYAGVTRPQDPTVLDQIRFTVALYAFAIDGKDFESLDLVFTDDAVANFSAPIGVVTSLSAIKSVVQKTLAYVHTQHKLSTQIIDISPNGCQAKSVTYLDASHFGQGNYTGQV